MSAGATRDSAYGAFAYAYDKALGERFFHSVKRQLEELMERYPSPARTHLDVACGTGLTLKYFASKGWRSVGVDASLAMLDVARVRAGRLVAADFRALPLRGAFARITCLYDSLNHLKNRTDLVAAFRAVRRVMSHESLFLFDMNHPDVYPAVWGMKEPYVASGDGYHLEIATAFRRRDNIGRALVTGWAAPHGRRIAIRETHEQRAYSEREIVEALGDAALAAVEVLDFDPYGEADSIEGGGVKLFFVCRAT
ncbi:MAG TPA: class I SAM-dependent methyltransferase [Thermoanaerobaculia bacterium]|nr:class I SAM-dependent methyltransferase [Thermoanaerobaculia bacterium]